MVHETISKFDYRGATIRIGVDTGGPIGSTHYATVDGDGYRVTRYFYFDEYHEQYAENFAKKVVDKTEYREASLERSADWAQTADLYEEAAKRINQPFANSECGLLSYQVGDDVAEARYEAAVETRDRLCEEVFDEISDRIRDTVPLGDIDEFIDERVQEANRKALILDPEREPPLDRGGLVLDTGPVDELELDENTSRAVVIELPDEPAGSHVIGEEGITVADYNEDYPADASVAVVVFIDDLSGHPGWMEADADQIKSIVEENDIRTYSYPLPRLLPVG